MRLFELQDISFLACGSWPLRGALEVSPHAWSAAIAASPPGLGTRRWRFTDCTSPSNHGQGGRAHPARAPRWPASGRTRACTNGAPRGSAVKGQPDCRTHLPRHGLERQADYGRTGYIPSTKAWLPGPPKVNGLGLTRPRPHFGVSRDRQSRSLLPGRRGDRGEEESGEKSEQGDGTREREELSRSPQ